MILYFPKHEKPSIYAVLRYVFNSGSTPVYSMATNRIKWGFLKCRVIFCVIHRDIFRVIVWYNILKFNQRRTAQKGGTYL